MAKGEEVRSDEQSADLDQYAKDALDEVFSKEQQSYDEFVQGFMFLTKDDVTGMKGHSSHSCYTDSITQNGVTSHGMATADVALQNIPLQKSQQTENDIIPEELLGPGSTAVPILLRTAESSSGAVLQVDNFVDGEIEESDEDDDDDDREEDNKKLHSFLEDDILSSNYSPSVLSISNSSMSQEVEESSTNDSYCKVDLDDENQTAAKDLEIHYLSDVSTLPGEVDDHETTEQQDTSCAYEAAVNPNIRQLQISTRINNCDKKDDQNNFIEEDVGSDEVQPFTLDTDFDYDNVALTPKFSFVPKHVS